MRCRIIAASIFLSHLASADSHKLLVLKSDGNADAATRAKVDAEVLRLAHSLGNTQVESGEITFGDAAAAVGCSGSEAQCRDDVLGTMGVDEVVSILVTAMPSGDTRVLVDRIPKGSPIKTSQTTVPAGQPIEAKLDADIGPIFGVKAPVASPEPAPTPPPPAPAPMPAIAQPAFGDTTPHAAPPNLAPTGSSGPTGASGGAGTDLQPAFVESHSNAPVIGMSVGGGLVVLALILWGEASATQGDINNAPTKSSADFLNLQNLESKGDTYAGVGNVFFVGGLVVAGISGYFFWRSHRSRASSTQAIVTPTLFDHGAGLALTIGGSP